MAGEIIGYISGEQATELIRLHIPEGQARRERWEELSAGGREAFLRRALIAIDSLIYSGRKKSPNQETAFPRRGQDKAPGFVMLAQAYEACALCLAGEEAASRAALTAQGMDAFSAGSLRESYRGAGRQGLISREAAMLLERHVRKQCHVD